MVEPIEPPALKADTFSNRYRSLSNLHPCGCLLTSLPRPLDRGTQVPQQVVSAEKGTSRGLSSEGTGVQDGA